MHQISDLQNRLDSAYKVLTEDFDKQKYLNELQQIQNEFPDLVKKEFLSRQDKRTFLEFGESIADHIRGEREIADFWMGNYGEQWFGTKSYQYKGVDSRGRLICASLKLRSTFKEPDLVINSNTEEEEYVELKTCRVLYKATYKEADIRHYGKLGNVNIVTLHATGQFSLNKVGYYTLLTPNGLSLLLDKMDSGEVKVEPRPEFGGRKCINFTREQLKNHFYVEDIDLKNVQI